MASSAVAANKSAPISCQSSSARLKRPPDTIMRILGQAFIFLIDTIRKINAWPNMRIMVSGGLFNRAEELWQEIGADLFAATALEAIQMASKDTPIESEERMINQRKRKR